MDKLPRSAQKQLQSTSKGMYTKEVLSNGKVRITGGKRLKSSGAYSAKFGARVAKLLKKKIASWPKKCGETMVYIHIWIIMKKKQDSRREPLKFHMDLNISSCVCVFVQ